MDVFYPVYTNCIRIVSVQIKMALKDHIKRGKKLLPKLLAGNFIVHGTSWQIERLPQFILLALYLEDNSLADAIDIFFQMNVSYDSILKDFRGDKIFRPFRMGEHLVLDEHEKQEIKQRSEGATWRYSIDSYLNKISSLFISNPMGYLLKASTNTHNSKCNDNIKTLKSLLTKTGDRRSKSSLFIQAVVVAVELRSGHTKICDGVDLPDLNAVVDYPNTEESENAAGFIVVHANSIATGMNPMNPGQLDMTWQRQFWDSCYRLEPCEFNYE